MRIYNLAVAFAKAHWFTLVAVGMVLYNVDKPYISDFVSRHSWAAVIWANVVAVWAWYQSRETFQQKYSKQVNPVPKQ